MSGVHGVVGRVRSVEGRSLGPDEVGREACEGWVGLRSVST